uniref:ATP synthase complex subunit 8 n=1 Tax=Orius sauteri TaxID=82747 RepID=A0A068FCE4_ORISA|nr:ATP synthase FO subunit 8 [Orius sauteri]YP_010432121.1 ATP synthase F0 subunit 8 [Orius strigicollis]AID61653.1 ATP synthase FO subunit 8 [Orius sauteri]USW04718.1 ATP synthase F0 subunit 8 [Orius strigicollis]
MPQMAPMWWLSLYFMFIMSFFMIMICMYYLFNKTFSSKEISIKKNPINWKW